MIHTKYPRTSHLPWSPGATSDDKILKDLSRFEGKRIIVSEKMDGENFSLYHSGLHARSLDGRHHVSQSWLRQWHAANKHRIPSNVKVAGEYLYAQHSISYKQLPSYFLVFAVFQDDICLCWEDTVAFCVERKFNMVPTLYVGDFDVSALKKCWTGLSKYGGLQEGYVARITDSCPTDEYPLNIAKYLRANHIDPSDKHWGMKMVVANGLKKY